MAFNGASGVFSRRFAVAFHIYFRTERNHAWINRDDFCITVRIQVDSRFCDA